MTRQVRNRLTGRSHPRQNPRGGGRVRGRHRGGPRAPCQMRTVCFRNRIKRTLLKRQRPPDSAHAMPDTGHVPAQPRGAGCGALGRSPPSWAQCAVPAGSGQAQALLGLEGCQGSTDQGYTGLSRSPPPRRRQRPGPPPGPCGCPQHSRELWKPSTSCGHPLWTEEAEAALGTTAAVLTGLPPRGTGPP